MATRHDIDQRRTTVYESLRSQCADGKLAPGQLLPPVREVAELYGVSPKVAWQAIQSLVDEGILHTVGRKGTFVGTPKQDFNAYLMTSSPHRLEIECMRQVQIGFEERVAQLGGVSMCLTEDEAQELFLKNELPPLCGMFRLEPEPLNEAWWPATLPTAEFAGIIGGKVQLSDRIHFDDLQGGRLATQHLLAMNHRQIAFLAMHPPEITPTDYAWSKRRLAGWAEVMAEAGISTEKLALFAHDYPEGGWINEVQFALANQIAREQILHRDDITAVITANVIGAESLIAALQEEEIAPDNWPAILCFDDFTKDTRSVVSCMRLPWDEMGRQAAQLLWERKTGRVTGPFTQRFVQMRLVQRLSCRLDHASVWATPFTNMAVAR